MTKTAMQKELVERVREGQPLAIARMISRVESGAPGVVEEIAELYAASGRAHVVGVTGAPGSGKSTLVSALTTCLRRRGESVGVLAIDPSSPFSGGAFLGDRIRMQDHAGDQGVFIRSMASRGALGGLSRATADATAVLDAAGKDYVVIETVGVGQGEVDIARAAHTTIVLSIPGTGDDVQAVKAGVLEIADIHVVNKADREGANRAIIDLRGMLRLSLAGAPGGWAPPVIPTVAASGDGIDELVQSMQAHFRALVSSGELERRERAMAAARVTSIAQALVVDRFRSYESGRRFTSLIDEVYRRELDPFSAANALLRPSA